MARQPHQRSPRAKAAVTAPEPTVLRMMREFQELARQVPQEEWDKVPADLLDNLDHYIYGSPKKPSKR